MVRLNNIINTPIEIYGRQVKNRIVFHPMEGCDGKRNGAIDELTRRRYLRFARSGAGIIWFEATAVCAEGRANPRQLFINEETVDGYAQLVAEIRQTAIEECGFAPLIIVQLTHSGRFSKPNGTPEPIVAYRNSHWEIGKENQPYTVATDDYCDEIAEKYAQAAKLAEKAGFDGIDVKCCHGYLFNEFLSAYDRKGKYGGSLENRMRLYLSCIDSVRESVSKAFVTTRFNACDCFPYPYGYGVNAENEIDLSETKIIINELKSRGIELINLTLGNPYLIPHFNRPCINAPEDGKIGMERIYSVTKEISGAFPEIKFIMSGLSFEGENAVDYATEAIEKGVAAFAGFGRMTFAYPDFYKDYLKNGKLDKSTVCLKCSKCTELMRNASVAGCPVRDSETYMPYYRRDVLKK